MIENYKIKENGKYLSKAVYSILGVNLTDLNNRCVKDIFIASVDRIKGFPESINSIFPKIKVQLCIVHQIRNSIRYVAYKNQKEFMKDLKLFYPVISKEAAEMELDNIESKW
ncbi:MAG: hypothetical protein CL623_01485 [Arcobacter sp.]|nr:hypothetical protein [Arcobacter sp.]|tara:strand:+ start:5263 stop:5598 length:336 start_codon:yes stop_codon:yes gene_type:complete